MAASVLDHRDYCIGNTRILTCMY